MLKYKTVQGHSCSSLDDQVNRLLVENWTLYGVPYSKGSMFYQAMMRDERVGDQLCIYGKGAGGTCPDHAVPGSNYCAVHQVGRR